MKKLVVIFTFLLFPSLAFSFPFRAVERGKKIPSVKLKKIDGSSFSVSPSNVKGKGLIILFWGADSEMKKKRATGIMEILNEVKEDNQEEIGVVAINSQGDPPEVINEVVSQINPKFPILLDKDRKAYDAFGVFVMPSVLMVNGEGLVIDGFGYSNVIRDKIEAEVLMLLGKISEQEAKGRMVLEVAEKPEKERKAMDHLELGKRMEDRGMPHKAKEEYARAVELFDDLAEAHIRLGAVLIEEGDLEGAEKAVNKALALDPDSLDSRITHARLRIAKGDLEGILEELQMLSFRFARCYRVRWALGDVYEAKGDLKNAVKEYKKTIELLRKEALHH